MYIRKQPSGSRDVAAASKNRGRGEYELSEALGEVDAADLIDHEFLLDAGPFGVLKTHVTLRSQGNKKRLRLEDPRRHIHLARQLDSLMLLPKPIRDESLLQGGRPVLREGHYILDRANVSKVLMQSGARAVLSFDRSDYASDRNRTVRETVNIPDRLVRVRRVHELAGHLEEPFNKIVAEHSAALANQVVDWKKLEARVKQLMEAIEFRAEDYGQAYIAGGDPLPVLEYLLALPVIELPKREDVLREPDPEIRRREVKDLKRLAAARGSAAREFSILVRTVYRFRCLFCGIRLRKTENVSRSGVDAAHILPYADYDLDVPTNGICACKRDHWLFEEGYLLLTPDGGGYRVEISTRAHADLGSEPETLAELKRLEGPVSTDRLPAQPANWPSPEYLQKLRDDMGL